MGMGFSSRKNEKKSQASINRKRAEYGFGEYGLKHRAQ